MSIPVSTPAEQGVDAAGLLALVEALDAHPAIEPHGLIVQRHGHRVAEGYWAPHTGDRRRLVYSLSKTFTGTALALQLGEGRLGLDDLVADHLPELFADAAPITRRMRIRHIASMSTGHDREMLEAAVTADPADPLHAFFSMPPEHEPGSWFVYNQPPVLALAGVLERLAGERLTDYLRPRLVEPLGMRPFLWQQASPGRDLGFSGVHTTLDDVAHLGQLYLDDGVWDGRRILPEGWVAAASQQQIDNPRESEVDWRQGYGFQLWMARNGFRGDGAYGQFMIVLPEQDATIAIFSATEDMQAVLDAVWQHLLPAMGDAARPVGDADRALADRLGVVQQRTAAQRVGGSVPDPADGAFRPESSAVSAALTGIRIEGGTVVLESTGERLELPLTEEWSTSAAFAVSAAQQGDRLVLDVAALETPHRLEIRCDPGDGVFRARWATQPLAFTAAGAGLLAQRAPQQ